MPSEYRRREALRQIAAETLHIVDAGSYRAKERSYSLHTREAKQKTRFYHLHTLSNWSSPPANQFAGNHGTQTHVSILEISTIKCARLLSTILRNNPHRNGGIGVLNFASATKPGGGFQRGAEAQEESIARSSNLFSFLTTADAQNFYDMHKAEPRNHFYTNSMIYSPGIEIFRDDDGRLTKPIQADVLTSAAVNADEVRRSTQARQRGRAATEQEIESVMKERMARILFLFEQSGVRNLVLGSFGTGVFRNNVDVVARLWAELLWVPGARFGRSFDRVFFAILGRRTYIDFGNAFNHYTHQHASRPYYGPDLPIVPMTLRA